MFKFLILLSFLLSAAAFAPAARSTRSTQLSMAEKSRALPFLEKPAKLDGSMVGDFGFDPMGISNTVNDLSYVQEAEIKHGRVAMLAVVGFVVQQYIQIVQPSSSDPIKAISTLGYGPNLQVLFAIGCIELINWDKTFSGKNPGDFGFDPLNFAKGKSESQMKDLKLKEIKNGRLAMIGIMGLLAQNLATGGSSTF